MIKTIYIKDSDKKYLPDKAGVSSPFIFRLLIIVLAVLLFYRCSGDDDEPAPRVEDVLLVYLGGDNNLTGESYDKLEAIAGGFKGTASRRILVYQDTQGTPANLLEISGVNDIRTLETYGEENSAGKDVFRRVILTGKTLYPDARFNLLVFSHASGWLPPHSLNNPKSSVTINANSILTDGDEEMELADFAGAIPDGSFECITLETCFSAGIEVIYQLRNKAQYILASPAEIVSPGFTPVYRENINYLLQGREGLEKFAEAAFTYFDNRQGEYRSATLSIIDTGSLEELAGFIRKNCDFRKTVTLDISSIQHFDRYSYRLFFDFRDYHSRLLETELQQKELETRISRCVIWKASTERFLPGYNGFNIDNYSGMTSYIMQTGFPGLNKAYEKMEWVEDSQ